MGKKRTLTDESKWGYILIAPTIIGLIVLNVYPFIQTLILSFSATHPFGIYEITGPRTMSACLKAGNSGKPPGTPSISAF